MNLSRRDLSFLLPALAAAGAAAQEKQARTLPAKMYHHGLIPYSGDEKKKGRRVLLKLQKSHSLSRVGLLMEAYRNG